MDLEKEKELYVLSNQLLEEEHQRFNRVGQKATAYLQVVSLLFGIATIFGKEVVSHLIPPRSFLEWLLLNMAILDFVCLAGTWVLVFRAYRFEGLWSRPLTQLIDFYINSSLAHIYVEMAKSNAVARDKNIKTTNKKIELLEKGHKAILTTAIVSAMFAVGYFGLLWTNGNRDSVSQRDAPQNRVVESAPVDSKPPSNSTSEHFRQPPPPTTPTSPNRE